MNEDERELISGPEYDILKGISLIVAEITGMSIFGFNVVKEENTGNFFIVDANYFPSFRHLDSIAALMHSHIYIKLTL